MKSFVLFMLIVSTSSALANEYCFDRAVMAIYRVKEDFIKCDPNFDASKFDLLAKRLSNVTAINTFSGAYQKKVVSSLGALYELYYTTLPYSDTTKDNVCLQAELKKFSGLKEKILDALVVCSP